MSFSSTFGSPEQFLSFQTNWWYTCWIWTFNDWLTLILRYLIIFCVRGVWWPSNPTVCFPYKSGWPLSWACNFGRVRYEL